MIPLSIIQIVYKKNRHIFGTSKAIIPIYCDFRCKSTTIFSFCKIKSQHIAIFDSVVALYSAATAAPRWRLCAVASRRRWDGYLLACFLIVQQLGTMYTSAVTDVGTVGGDHAFEVVHSVVNKRFRVNNFLLKFFQPLPHAIHAGDSYLRAESGWNVVEGIEMAELLP